MDINGDGINDILSGCYSQSGHASMVGSFWVLAGQEDGTFAKAVELQGTDGKLLQIVADLESTRDNRLTENICTRPFAVDWDGDGDLDIVAGNFAGTFYLFTGEGEGKFQPTATQLKTADGTALKTSGVHSDPTVIDFDGDGDLDLLATSNDGAIVWSENKAIDGPATAEGESSETVVPGPAKLSAFQTLIFPPGKSPQDGVVTASAEYNAGITAAYDVLDAEKWAEADAAFRAVIASNPAVPDGYYHLACRFTREAGKLEGDARQSAIKNALDLLAAAIEKGWRNTAHMKSDPDMEILRELDTYTKVLAGIAPPPKPVGPAGSTRMHVEDVNGDGKLDFIVGDCVTIDGKRTGTVWLYLQK